MALAFDASSQGNQDSGTSVTFAHTMGSGLDRILVVFVRLSASSDLVTGVTYNGVSMSSAGASVLSNDSARRLYAFYLINPASGTNNIVISVSGTNAFRGHAFSYTGAKQTSQPDSYNGASPSSTTTPSINLTPNLANCWALIGVANNSDDPVSESNWATRISAGGQASGDSNGKVSASTVAYGMTYGSAVSNAMIALSIAAANEPSASPSLSPSASQSPSASGSSSASPSLSPSASASASASRSLSPSASQSPSASGSASASRSLSPSASQSPSSSTSASASASASRSVSPSQSPSASFSPSSSLSQSASASPSIPPSNFSRQASSSPPNVKTDLAVLYTEQEVLNVESDDGIFVDLQGTSPIYLLHQYKFRHTNNRDTITVNLKFKSSLAPSSSTVYLQIYNLSTHSWETIAIDSSSEADTEVSIKGLVSTNLTNYYDESNLGINEVTIRIYQNNP